MKRIGFVFLLFIIQVGAYAQDYHVVDSIKQLLKQQQVQDTNTVMRYLYLGGEYVWSVPDTAIYYDNKALSLSRQLHFTHGEFFALVNRAYPLAVVREDSTAVASAYGAISMAEALKNKQYIVYAYSALGTVYLHLKEFDKGILYHRKALAYESTVNPYFLQSYNEHLAQCFLGLNRPDSALYYVNKALEDDKQIQYSSGFDWYLIGNIYLQKGLPDSALRYYREGLAMVTEKRVFKDMADCNLGIANVFLQKNKFDSAIYYAKNGWIVASKTRLPNEKLDALNLLTSLFASQKKIDSAYKYQQYATLLKDSIYNAAKVRQVQLLAFNDDLRKLQDAETARKRLNANIIIALVALLLFAFTIVAIIYNHNKKRKKAYALLQKQKEEIDNKNKELEMESALEKVRSRSLAMRQSDELQEVVRVVFEQLQHLGISFDFASIDLYHEDAKDFDSYSCGWAGNEFLTSNRYITYFDHPIMNDIIEAREKGIDFHVKTYTKEEINSALQYAFEHTELKEQPDDVKAQMLANKGYTIARAFGKNCAVNINNWSAQEITDSEKNILIRFAKVFEQAYTRFLDLQKAEAQAREAQIQLALERVRAKTMAMQKPSEYVEVINVIGEQFINLGFQFDWVNFSANGHDVSKVIDIWNFVDVPGVYQGATRLMIPYFDHPVFSKAAESVAEYVEHGNEFTVVLLNKKEKDQFLDHLFTNTIYKDLPDEVKADHYNQEVYLTSNVVLKDTWLSIGTYKKKFLTEEQISIEKRLAREFGQAYTRFLDLQRAEAQAREAQVEAALERVRSRSLAMHHSNELQDVVGVMYEQLTKLGFNKNEDVVSICLFDDDTGEMPSWAAGNDGAVPFCLITPKNEYAIYTNIWKARANGEDFLSKVYSREEKNAFWGYLFAQNNYAQLPQKDKDDLMQGEGYAYDIAIAKHACIMYLNFHGRLTLNDEQKEILKRFVNVFEQAYIRFLDLQRAEAQAREAHIEAALERVRSRSMGMQKSEELREVIQLILDQLLGLHFPIDAATITVEFNESNDARVWLAAPGQQYATRIDVPYIDHPIFNRTVEAKEKGETFYTLLLTKEEKNRYFDHFFKYAPVTEERRKWLYSSAGWVMSAVLMNTVALTIYNYSAIPYSEEQNKTLIRFGNVFQQTYTRFLDLQRAEAQAREAQIEAALERVRSRSMGMQKSEELREVIQVIFDQLCSLHINLDFASFAVEIDKTNDLRNWVASPLSQYATRIDIPYIDHPLFNRLIEAKEKGEAFITLQLNQEEKDRFFDHYFQFAAATEERKSYVFKSKSWVLSIVVMRSLMLTMANYSGTPFSDEENKTLMRFGKAFEQTYTRFLDLQKAEAAAREAVKQASIDRVRAEIASMRTTKDLDRIIPLIWNELTLLHIPFIRCGVFIVNEDAQQTQVYLSTPEGKAIAAFQLPFNSEGLNKNMLEHWRNNQLFIDHWDAERFSEWTHSLVAAGAIQPNERYSHEQPPENLYLHFIPFMQGMLYVGNTAPLSEEELSLIESLADAFSTAYARYEDFSKLEAAKQQIETTLTELKSTQSQLIQKEKMASLGELTAGIAHEIQNPLNFVNNFSEINTELMEELKEERIKKNGERDEQLEKDLLEDIEQNLQKILHHGKRADSIVKGMLQHSRASSGKKEWVHLNALVDEYLRLSYHGLRAKDKSFNTDFTTHFDESIDKVNVIPQDISRVLLNLFNNAFYAVNERKKQLNGAYEPVVSVVTKKLEGKVEITVSDNGNGIPLTIINKIFQPFFTTKPTGQGTGLGLSLSYDIIKAHGGEIKVESKEGEGTTFIIHLQNILQ